MSRGAELDVLLGAEKMFKEKKIKCCVFEFGQTTYDMGYTANDLIKFFKDVNYPVRNLSKYQRLYPINKKTGIAEFAIHIAQPKNKYA